ncbi:hypothetical protein BDB00DRAFT_803631 [Zychaea mexicana]|uniref:uncharacterized protein n=1 Tax=Zychaea mexicana TaxID=64656 RepID=UPI0022FDF619|nr:uncharacterized protein BDB00DRAFT_803631 [Zychaea mexicana]KAI9497689.1 hypothetical protein BDB00DRAFT_803631 [Zychaea mexicana]
MICAVCVICNEMGDLNSKGVRNRIIKDSLGLNNLIKVTVHAHFSHLPTYIKTRKMKGWNMGIMFTHHHHHLIQTISYARENKVPAYLSFYLGNCHLRMR